MEVANTNSNFNISQLNDSLLAGLYANGYTNLENINTELFNSISNWDKIFAKFDNSSSDNEVSLITSVISSLINNKEGDILFVVSDTTQVEKYKLQFKKVSNYVNSVDIRTIQEESTARLIIADVKSISSNIENVKYIIVNDCITNRLVTNLKYKDINIAFLSTEINNTIIENVKKLAGDDIESATTVPVVESATTVPVVESNTTVPVVESATTVPVVESATTVPVVESATTVPVVESNTTVPVVESATTVPVVESNISIVKEEIEFSTRIEKDNSDSDSDSDSEFDLNDLISQLNIPNMKDNVNKEKDRIKDHNKKILLQMRSRGLRR